VQHEATVLVGTIKRWSAMNNAGWIEVDPDQDRKSDVPFHARHCRFKPQFGQRVAFEIGTHDGGATAVKVALYGESKREPDPVDNRGLAKLLNRGVTA
jgi:cold shock CspA family protein